MHFREKTWTVLQSAVIGCSCSVLSTTKIATFYRQYVHKLYSCREFTVYKAFVCRAAKVYKAEQALQTARKLLRNQQNLYTCFLNVVSVFFDTRGLSEDVFTCLRLFTEAALVSCLRYIWLAKVSQSLEQNAREEFTNVACHINCPVIIGII